MTGLLTAADLDAPLVHEVFRLSQSFLEVSARRIPKVPALRGRTVASLFFEDSTRTRLSFETAAKRLSADVMTFTAGSSSLSKGESIRDTIETIDAMGVDAMVIRHGGAGVPAQATQWTSAAVVNAGDGAHQHPTQALLDAFTLHQHFGSLDGLRIAVVGDIRHSRVARSDLQVFTTLGAHVTMVAPTTLLPAGVSPGTAGWPDAATRSIDEVLGDVDVVYLLRMQSERMAGSPVPSLREYTARFGLTRARAERLGDSCVVMHPGPMNRGVEIAGDLSGIDNVLVIDQVRNGVAVRMAVLWWLLGSGTDLVPSATEADTAGSGDESGGDNTEAHSND